MNADSCVVWERVREPVSSGAAACVRYGTRLENVPEEVQGLGAAVNGAQMYDATHAGERETHARRNSTGVRPPDPTRPKNTTRRRRTE